MNEEKIYLEMRKIIEWNNLYQNQSNLLREEKKDKNEKMNII
jgi:hypothetical protein